MRAVKLTEFLSLPDGTLYEQVSPDRVPEGMVMVKGSTLVNSHDWYEMSVGGATTLLSEDYPNSLDGWCALFENSDLSVPYQDDVWGRHGLYPTEKDDYTFFIYEPDDVAKMVSLLTAAWFQSKYPNTRFEWGYNGIVTLIENLLEQSTNDQPTVIYQILTRDGWLDCPREDYLRTYKTDPNCTRIVSLVVEGRNDLVLNYFQASMLDAATTRETATATSDIVTVKVPEPDHLNGTFHSSYAALVKKIQSIRDDGYVVIGLFLSGSLVSYPDSLLKKDIWIYTPIQTDVPGELRYAAMLLKDKSVSDITEEVRQELITKLRLEAR